jgi:hypothetical protein
MKREINCPKCAESCKQLIGKYKGEHIKIQEGKAKAPFICDQCAALIDPGDPCVCVSVWADYGGIQYFPWESEAMELTNG